MRRVILFIAMSLDGYIAGRNGNVDWLNGQSEQEETPDTYSDFIRDVDTVILGWNTYHQIVTELFPSQWVYEGLTSWVITHRQPPPAKDIFFAGENPCDVVRRLKQEPGKHIWICGGADIVRQLMEADLIDDYRISVIPVILGAGTRLFGTLPRETKLRLIRTQTGNGITELFYTRRSLPDTDR